EIGKGLSFVGIEQEPFAGAAVDQDAVNSPLNDVVEHFPGTLLVNAFVLIQRGHDQTLISTDLFAHSCTPPVIEPPANILPKVLSAVLCVNPAVETVIG